MDNKAAKPSHIILYVNKNIPKDDLSSFCTNVRSKEPDTEFTYLSYDNQFSANTPDSPVNLTDNLSEDAGSLFIITDSDQALKYAIQAGIPCAGLEGAGSGPASGVLYCIEDISFISYDRILKMWQRCRNIPWVIAETPRLVIREQTLDDIDALYEIYDDSEAKKFVEDLYEDRRQEEEYLRKYIENQYRFYEFGLWALSQKDSGRLIGRAGIGIREGYDIPELGYMLAKQYRGMGYATEALTAIMEYGTEELGFLQYMAFTSKKNIPSVRLLESLGFSLRGHELIMGREHDMYILTKQ